jgi:hypothetical protein
MNAVASQSTKTHFRKAFHSPYLSSADLVEPTALTVRRVALEIDKTKKTKELFNTAYFAEAEIRPGEKLKPMILNATNSKMMKDITGAAFIEDWVNIRITVYVQTGIKFGNEVMDGLRIMQAQQRRTLTPEMKNQWDSAKKAYRRDGNLAAVLERMDMSDEHQAQLADECQEMPE